MLARRVEVLGVPFDSAGTTAGVAGAPAALRAAGLVEALETAGLNVTDRGDVRLGPTNPARDPVTGLIAPDALASMIELVGEAVDAILEREAWPLVLGGDCPVLLGCLGGASRDAAPGLLFIDGHEDAWPPRLSTTGEAADMELGFALGLTLDGLPEELIAVVPRLDRMRVVVVGPRDEAELADAGVTSIEGTVEVIRPHRIATSDPAGIGAELGSRLARSGPWWLHVDLDVLATESLDAVDYPQPGGLDWQALARFTIGALGAPDLLGWDVTIYNPDLDPGRRGARRIVRYLAEALGAATA